MTIRKSTKMLIKAPVEKVFDAVANVGEYKNAAPHIVKIEVLSDVSKGVGTRFRETRLMNGKESSTVLDCTEYEENERARFVADQGGTIWDTVFTTKAVAGGTELDMEMEARPHKFMAKIVTPLIMGFVSKAVEGDMAALKTYCEATAV